MSLQRSVPKTLWSIRAYKRKIGDWESPPEDCSEEVLGKDAKVLFSDRQGLENKAESIRNRELVKPRYPGWRVIVEVRATVDIT
jgi:hypothetical protein